jgi:hypothetical protein
MALAIETLSHSYDTGRPDLAASHDEHQPGFVFLLTPSECLPYGIVLLNGTKLHDNLLLLFLEEQAHSLWRFVRQIRSEQET